MFKIYLAILVTVFGATGSFAQSDQPKRDQPIESLDSLWLSALIRSSKAGGSVILEPQCGIREPIARSSSVFVDGTDPFFSVINAKAGYRVLREDDSVNLLPFNYEPELLTTTVRSYVVSSNKKPSEELAEILALPELSKAIEASGLRKWKLVIGGGLSSPPIPKDEAVVRQKTFSNISLRDLLNQIALFHGKAVWLFNEYQCEDGRRSSLQFVKQK